MRLIDERENPRIVSTVCVYYKVYIDERALNITLSYSFFLLEDIMEFDP